MKSLREQFENDYTAISMQTSNQTDFKVRYIYYAPWYLWDIPESSLKKKKRLLASISATSLLLLLITGTRKNPINSYILVELAGILALCAHVLEISSMFQFLSARYRTSRMTYSAINRVLGIVPLVRGLCLSQAVAGGIYYMLQDIFNLKTAFVTSGYLVCALMAFYIFKEYRRIPMKTEKNTSLEDCQNHCACCV